MKFWMMLLLAASLPVSLFAADPAALPPLPESEMVSGLDWLVDTIEAKAGVYHTADGKGIILSNGLLRRTFRLEPNAATTGFDNFVSGEVLLRGKAGGGDYN